MYIKKIKISGLLQAQYQKADSAKIAAVSGDDFVYGFDNRFNLRRGRIKGAYTGEFSESSVQFDITDKGISLKEAYFYNRPVDKNAHFSSRFIVKRGCLIKKKIKEALSAFDLIVGNTREIIRSGRKFERRKRPKKPHYMNYKDL